MPPSLSCSQRFYHRQPLPGSLGLAALRSFPTKRSSGCTLGPLRIPEGPELDTFANPQGALRTRQPRRSLRFKQPYGHHLSAEDDALTSMQPTRMCLRTSSREISLEGIPDTPCLHPATDYLTVLKDHVTNTGGLKPSKCPRRNPANCPSALGCEASNSWSYRLVI